MPIRIKRNTHIEADMIIIETKRIKKILKVKSENLKIARNCGGRNIKC